ncbi:MAG TPA: hypothetical protein VGJ05_02450 [Fimbriiglobus sp.]|jgi:hypothetical protein
MPASRDLQAFQQRMAGVEAILHRIETAADPAMRSLARELVQALLDLHGTGLERILSRAEPLMVEALVKDDLVSSLLLLHDLHPQDLETRVRKAMAGVTAALRDRGGQAELIEVLGPSVRLRLVGRCDADAAAAMQTILKEVVELAAPDATAFDLENALEIFEGKITLPLLQSH